MKKLNAYKFILTISILSSVFISCATTGPGGKKSIIIISTAQEVAIGAGMDEELRQTEKIFPDYLWQNYINEIGQKIVAGCDRKDIEYKFTVIESDQINAFAAPGGFIYFYTGLIKEMNNEAELASVMAHEISHVVGRHGIKRLQAAMGVSMAYQFVFGGEGAGEILNTVIGLGMGLMFADYSRDNEREADIYGIHYMIKSGYHPNGMITMFDILAEKGGTGDLNIFEKLSSSHPNTIERIKNAKAEISAIQPMKTGLTLGENRFKNMLKRLN